MKAKKGRLRSGLLYKQMLRIFGFSTIFFSYIFISNAPPEQTLNYYALMYMSLGSVFGVVFFVAVIYNMYKEPVEFKVLLIGPPQSGKTIFITVMLHKLKDFLDERLLFTFDDRNTIAAIAKGIEYLTNQQWLPSTNGSANSYKIRAKIGTRIFNDSMKINVVDMPFKPKVTPAEGDNPPNINYGDLIGTLKNYDGLMLFIDSQVVVGNRPISIDELQDLYIPLLKELPRDGGEGSKTSIPVAIIFSKTDSIEFLMNPLAMRKFIPKLLEACKKECKNYRMFYVSSIGNVDALNMPLPSLPSKNVIDPMTWTVKAWE
jgi:GTPase SAR1 family protein